MKLACSRLWITRDWQTNFLSNLVTLKLYQPIWWLCNWRYYVHTFKLSEFKYNSLTNHSFVADLLIYIQFMLYIYKYIVLGYLLTLLLVLYPVFLLYVRVFLCGLIKNVSYVLSWRHECCCIHGLQFSSVLPSFRVLFARLLVIFVGRSTCSPVSWLHFCFF